MFLHSFIDIFPLDVCGLGYEPNRAGTACSECATGFYSDLISADLCSQCSSGFSTSGAGSSSSSDCIGKCYIYIVLVVI